VDIRWPYGAAFAGVGCGPGSTGGVGFGALSTGGGSFDGWLPDDCGRNGSSGPTPARSSTTPGVPAAQHAEPFEHRGKSVVDHPLDVGVRRRRGRCGRDRDRVAMPFVERALRGVGQFVRVVAAHLDQRVDGVDHAVEHGRVSAAQVRALGNAVDQLHHQLFLSSRLLDRRPRTACTAATRARRHAARPSGRALSLACPLSDRRTSEARRGTRNGGRSTTTGAHIRRSLGGHLTTHHLVNEVVHDDARQQRHDEQSFRH
jgi:hypothetical protein